MSRVLTTIVQLFLVGSVLILGRMMWPDLKTDLQEMKNDLLNRK
jgi:hypothetical protein